ncbi:C40 family peptidase [Burkholderia pseudomallei]
MDTLLRETEQRAEGLLWIGDPPPLLGLEDLDEGAIVFGVGSVEQDDVKTRRLHDVIQYGSSGPYVHVGILLQGDEADQLRVFEAVRAGVQMCSLDVFRNRYRYVAVFEVPALRYRASIDAARRFARHQVHARTPYSRSGALLAPLRQWLHQRRVWKWPDRDPTWSSRPPMARPASPRSYFCSQFVIDTIRAAGVLGFDTNLLKPTCYTPMMLAESHGIFGFKGYVAEGYDVLDSRDPVIAGTVYASNPKLRAAWGGCP